MVISFTSVEEAVSGPLVNLSEGGAYIRTTKTKPIGTHLWLRIAVEDEKLIIEAQGTVARVISIEAADLHGVVPGMGIRFTNLGSKDREAIRQLVSAILAVARRGA